MAVFLEGFALGVCEHYFHSGAPLRCAPAFGRAEVISLIRLPRAYALGYKSVAATRLARWLTPSIARLFKSCLCLCVSVVKTKAGSSLRSE